MADILKAIRGMNDILPEDMPYWHHIESILRHLAKCYGYSEIRTPILEKTALFKRSIGEVTDIVEKEMYSFDDRNGDSLSMRPEGTASIVRAGIEHGLFYNQQQKLWYLGPIFRHERPQKGRYRQFHQFGLEAIGMAGPAIDAELILFNARLWKLLGLSDGVELQLNSLGSQQTRAHYREVLVDYFTQYQSDLDDESQRRLRTNPLRLLDSKNPSMKAMIADAPKLTDYLDELSKSHFDRLQALLHDAGVPFVVNPRLVRGLDYYTDTVFEWVTDKLGAQGTISAGGRYDPLIEQLGGRATPAVGFAMGIERIIELLKLETDAAALDKSVDVYLVLMGDAAVNRGLILAEKLRNELPDLHLMSQLGGGSYKSQFKKADKSGAKIALILGDSEVEASTIGVKFLREDRDQETIEQDKLLHFLTSLDG